MTFVCGARWSGTESGLALDAEFYYPDSLADLYTRVTELLGFTPDADEHKTQWLSASGDESLVPLFQRILGRKDAPCFDRQFFDPGRMTQGGFSGTFFEALGSAPEQPFSEAQRGAIATGVQRAIEGAVLALAGNAKTLCIAGGLAFKRLPDYGARAFRAV